MLSAAAVVENRTLRGTCPDNVSTVSQPGIDEGSIVMNGAGVDAEPSRMSTRPGTPEFRTYDTTPAAGVAVTGEGGTTCNVTCTRRSGAGADTSRIVAVFTVPALKLPHPEAATKLKFTAVADAVPPLIGLIVNHDGGGEVELSTSNGEPPGVVERTAIATAGPGVYVGFGAPGVRVHTRFTAVGVIVSGEVVPAVTVRFAVPVTSSVDPLRNRKVRDNDPAVVPLHPLATRTV